MEQELQTQFDEIRKRMQYLKEQGPAMEIHDYFMSMHELSIDVIQLHLNILRLSRN